MPKEQSVEEYLKQATMIRRQPTLKDRFKRIDWRWLLVTALLIVIAIALILIGSSMANTFIIFMGWILLLATFLALFAIAALISAIISMDEELYRSPRNEPWEEFIKSKLGKICDFCKKVSEAIFIQ